MVNPFEEMRRQGREYRENARRTMREMVGNFDDEVVDEDEEDEED